MKQVVFILPSSRKSLAVVVLLLLLLLTLALIIETVQKPTSVTVQKPTQTGQHAVGPAIQHFLYVLPDGGIMYVYDIDHNHTLVKEITLPPEVRFIRGAGADSV